MGRQRGCRFYFVSSCMRLVFTLNGMNIRIYLNDKNAFLTFIFSSSCSGLILLVKTNLLLRLTTSCPPDYPYVRRNVPGDRIGKMRTGASCPRFYPPRAASCPPPSYQPLCLMYIILYIDLMYHMVQNS